MKQILFVSLLVFIVSNNLRNLATYNWSGVYTQLVARHNTLRAKHKAGKLATVSALASLSQTVANGCAAKGGLNHMRQTYGGQYVGQNLYGSGSSSGVGPTGAQIADSWYNEYKDYDFAKGASKNGKTIGHFTQLVWASTKQIGCAYAVGKYGGTKMTGFFICCDYFPAGNVQGYYTKNVFK